MVGEALGDLETPSWAVETSVGQFDENIVVDGPCKIQLLGPPIDHEVKFFGLFLAFFGPSWAAFVVGGASCDLKSPS